MGRGRGLSCWWAIVIAMCFVGAPGQAQAGEVLLYDVDFGTPPHTPGEPPVLGDGPAPRKTPSEIPMGKPLVVEALGALTDQPCAFGDHPVDPYDQLKFCTEQGGAHGFPDAYGTYRVELIVLVDDVDPNLRFKVFMDCPLAHSVEFDSEGDIRAIVLGEGGYNNVIGSYTKGTPIELEIEVKIESQTWWIRLEGEEAFTGAYPSEELRAVRLSLYTNLPADPVAVDNVVIWGIGQFCPADFDGDGDVDTADLLYLLAAWGTGAGDVDGDGDTDTADLLALLAAWGECP
jgi:hypothetical protein